MFNRSADYISDKQAEQEMLDFLYDKYGVEFISYGVRKNEPGFAQMYVDLGDPEHYWSVARKVNETCSI